MDFPGRANTKTESEMIKVADSRTKSDENYLF